MDRTQVSKDPWLQPFYKFFDTLANRPSALIAIIVIVLAVTAGVVTYINQSESRTAAANNALFDAQKSLDNEMKSWAASSKPAAPPAESKGKVSKAPEAPTPESMMYTKTDVDSRFPEALKKFKDVIERYPGTRAAFEARMSIGSLYYNHSEPSKAIPWYQQAAEHAPKNFDRALALSSLGYSQENAGQYADAIQSYQKALNLGEGSLKGDLLLSIARGYELMHDSAKARSTYDQIISQLPNSEQAKTAELLKSQLPS